MLIPRSPDALPTRRPIARPSLGPLQLLLFLLPLLAGCDFIGVIEAEFDVRESVEQLHVTNAEPGTVLTLRQGFGPPVAEGVVDALGSLMFREVEPGAGYVVMETGESPREASGPHTVMSRESSLPDHSFYQSQTLEPGYNYITTRDGTQLSAYVFLPGPPEDGPYPTIIGYSGYEPSRPGAPIPVPDELQLLVQLLCIEAFTVLCDAPNHPVGVIGGLWSASSVASSVTRR